MVMGRVEPQPQAAAPAALVLRGSAVVQAAAGDLEATEASAVAVAALCLEAVVEVAAAIPAVEEVSLRAAAEVVRMSARSSLT